MRLAGRRGRRGRRASVELRKFLLDGTFLGVRDTANVDTEQLQLGAHIGSTKPHVRTSGQDATLAIS